MSLRETHFRTAPPDTSTGASTSVTVDLMALGSADIALLAVAGCVIVGGIGWVFVARRANDGPRQDTGVEFGIGLHTPGWAAGTTGFAGGGDAGGDGGGDGGGD